MTWCFVLFCELQYSYIYMINKGARRTFELQQEPHYCMAHKDASMMQLFHALQMYCLSFTSKFHEDQIIPTDIFSTESELCF